MGYYEHNGFLVLGQCFIPLSAILQLYFCCQFYW